MTSKAGVQHGVQGSFCFCGDCSDRGVRPRQFTVVHLGDVVTISMAGGALIDAPRCSGNCAPEFLVAAPGCGPRVGVQKPLVEDEPWAVDVGAGTYVLWVDSAFKRDDNASGDTSVALGLIVDQKRQREIIEPTWVDCAPSLENDGGL